MREPIDLQLTQRRSRVLGQRRMKGVVASLILHSGIAAALFFGPSLLASRSEPLEFVAVQIVPLQALGTPQPRPAPPKPSPPEPAIPTPEKEKKPPPEPEKKTETKPRVQPKTQPAEAKSAAGRDKSPRPAPEQQQPQGSPTGNPAGTSPFGAAVAALDNPDFTYGYYLDQMLGLIGSNWRPPVTGEQLQAVVHFVVTREGVIQEVSVAESSGNSAFDLAGLRAVQSSSPLPPLPASYRHQSLGVNLILR